MAKWKGNQKQGFVSTPETERDRRYDDLIISSIPSYNPAEPIPNKDAIASPNQPPNKIQDESTSNKLSNINRAENQRRDDDNIKNNSINIIDVDSAIINYLNNGLNLQVTENNGNIIKVPCIYGSPENWKASKIDGYIRDKKGQIQCPIIMIKRNSISRNSSLASFNTELSTTYIPSYSNKNIYDKFSILNKNSLSPSVPVKEVYNIKWAKHMIFSYDCIIWTDYIFQLNKIIESINYRTYEYWGDPQRFKFYVKIDEFNNQTETGTDEDRMIRANFNLTVNGYLVPETDENRRLTTEKSLTPRKIVFSNEIVNKINKN